ncbi:Colicin V production protein [Caloramator fervidus]|uniref:Colicin V production protein n=1 Tax=Caloramator fervidus TaxID=29344 RepID=A0A1H5WGD5_9CLOT|nr:CvpA family protein [Caloramator fervidus]SEF98505.1 Colicin V production protein [Caloramator fervidus]
MEELIKVNYLDIAVVLILLYGSLDGMQKGFVLTLVRLFFLGLSIYFSKVLSPYVMDYIINNTNIYRSMQKVFLEKISSKQTLDVLNLFVDKKYISRMATDLFLTAATYFLVFLILNILFNIIRENIKIRKGKLGFLDKLLGMILGFLKCFFIISLIFALLTPIINISSRDSLLNELIQSSKVAKYFYHYNIIFPIIKKINSLR